MRLPHRSGIIVRLLGAAVVAACASGESDAWGEETTAVVVRLPVARTEAARSAVGRDSAGAPPSGRATVTMEVPAVPSAASPGAREALDGVAYLRSRRLMVPVAGIGPSALLDTFDELRGGGARHHEALDIHAPYGTPVLAADDGRVAKLHESVAGGLTLYQFDPSERFVYYYAHLSRYRSGLGEGDVVGRGEVLAYVGTSGNAPAGTPHLHFAIGRLDSARRWWRYEAIDPFGLLVEPGRAAGVTPAEGQISPP